MEQLHFITKLLDIKDPNIQILDIINKDTHKEIIAKLDYDAPSCPECGNQLKKYDFQKPSKIPYLETTGMLTRILLRKRRFKCYHCSKMMIAETSIVKKNHQIPRIINQKIAQKLIEKISMTDIAHQLSISTSTVFESSMTSSDCFNREMEMSFMRKILKSSISSLFLKVEHKLSSEITFLNMIEPSDVASKSLLWICLALDLAKQLQQSPRLFHSRMLKSFLIAFTLYNILAVL
ncbi:putative IS1167 transposase [Streptococcus pneumoniae GA08825]|nr:putative IS1167 transposase [Streptococcus pneumoniae GA08825]